jgi:hypothetical protein
LECIQKVNSEFRQWGNPINVLTTLVQEVVESHYRDILYAKDFEEGNQLEEETIISMQVKEAFKDRSFLQNGHDANVSGPCDPAPACSMPLTISLTPCSL